MKKYSMDQFYNWLTQPMTPEDVDTWNRANNIIPEFTELFRDFCLSLLGLVQETYLGDSHGEHNETKIGLTTKDKEDHFAWCWKKTLDNFKKESIVFDFKKDDYRYFENFFFDVFYEQENDEIKKEIKIFFSQLFDRNRVITKSDIEMFTDVYKALERSLK